MLSSPITVTIDGTAHSLNRINQDAFGSTYLKKATGLEVQLDIRHTREGKAATSQIERHNVDLKMTTFDVDGVPTVHQAYTVIRAVRGGDPEVPADVVTGLNAWLTTNAAAIVAWQS